MGTQRIPKPRRQGRTRVESNLVQQRQRVDRRRRASKALTSTGRPGLIDAMTRAEHEGGAS